MSTPPAIGPLAVGFALAAIAPIFAAADVAVNALPEGRLELLAEDERDVFKRFADQRPHVLSRWLFARVAAMAASAALLVATACRAELFPFPELAALGTVLVYAALADVLGAVARRRPERFARFALRVLRPIELVLAPAAAPLTYLGRFTAKRVAPELVAPAQTEAELEAAVERGAKAGALDEEPATMIRRLLEFRDLTARDLMIPRPKILGIEVTRPLREVLALAARDGHSRYPVYRDTIDNVVGVLYVKDLFDVLRRGDLERVSLGSLLRKPVLFVAETQQATSILREMRARRMHLAVVSDEFGGTAGIVSLEDVIEEIVGDIRDEYDEETANVQKLADGRFVADAAMPLSDLEQLLGRSLPDEGDFESVGGLVLHHAGRVPSVGSTLSLDGYELIVREADEKRVVKVEIVLPPKGDRAKAAS